jgi:hypothetical protein
MSEVKGVFSMLMGWVPAGSISYWLTAERGRDGEIWHPPPTIEVICCLILWVFLTLPRQVMSRDIPPAPPPPVAQFLHFSADPGQIT